jgi:hypothetical protein
VKHTKPYIIQTPHCRDSCFKNYAEDAITSSTSSLSLVDCIPKDKTAPTETPYFSGSFSPYFISYWNVFFQHHFVMVSALQTNNKETRRGCLVISTNIYISLGSLTSL